MAVVVFVFFCPRCDNKYESYKSSAEVFEAVKTHVSNAHSDYDPLWYETYPNTPIEGVL